ncbi:MAG TPA: tetratricopeptide repeat protein [Gemmataceae bacterium]|nr:tetratricopeptide repeat protein [Gemmataceae bacterium]
MPRGLRLASLLVAVAGCQAISPALVRTTQTAPAAEVRAKAPAEVIPAEATEEPRPTDAPPPDALSLAADCLDRGDESAAVRHLEKHVGEHPDQVVFRAQLADLLSRLDRLPEAQAHYEAAAACAQDGPPVARKGLVRYHTRLMEIARQRGDAYAEHLHQGIGLYVVAGRLGDAADAGDVERLLCKAATALKEAQDLRPGDARPAWYLYRVWSQLDQPRPAEKALRMAAANAPFSRLTPTEARDLALATAGPPAIISR